MSWLLPLRLLGMFRYTAYRRAAGAGGGVFGVGRSKATEVTAGEVGVTYKDVGGADEAIAEDAIDIPAIQVARLRKIGIPAKGDAPEG